MIRAVVLALACAGCYDFDTLGTKPSSCATLGGFMCDGFEDKLPAPPQWIDLHGSASGTDDVNSQRAYRGSYSFHVHGAATNGSPSATLEVGGRVTSTQQAYAVSAATALQSHVYLRAFYFFPSLTGGRLFLEEIGRVPTANLPYSGFAVFIDVGGTFVLSQQSAISNAGPMAPTGRWICVELGLDNTTGDAQLWLDGAVTPNLTLAGTPLRKDPLDSSSTLNVDLLAFEYYNSRSFTATTAFDAWIDEIAVDSARIGCSR